MLPANVFLLLPDLLFTEDLDRLRGAGPALRSRRPKSGPAINRSSIRSHRSVRARRHAVRTSKAGTVALQSDLITGLATEALARARARAARDFRIELRRALSPAAAPKEQPQVQAPPATNGEPRPN